MSSIIDHKNKLNIIKDLARVTKADPTVLFPKIDYDKMVKPPIYTYIPIQTINQIRTLIHDPRLMARPSRKYKMMNDILRPFGIKHLASGTNRRTFYCDYDESIVFKIGIDSVGEEANRMEFYSQHALKPFCAKMYDLTPDGTIALSERVETMTEEEYRKVYSENIFDLIFMILNRGYIMEDVGVNFYKNWGIRFGFGPVVLDYPYVFQVDWSKLKCMKPDPITGDKCLGDLDYNYRKGMSEIICKKCGARYSARHLASISNKGMTQINRGGNKMPLVNTNIKTAIRRNGKIVNRFYAENEVKRDPSTMIRGDVGGIITTTLSKNSSLGEEVEKKAQKVSQELIGKVSNVSVVNKTDNENKEYKYHYYPRAVKNDIIYFLKSIEKNHGSEMAKYLADRIEIKYFTEEEFKEHMAKRKMSDDDWRNRHRTETNQLNSIGDKENKDESAKPVEAKVTVVEPEEVKTELHPVDHETAMKMADEMINSIPNSKDGHVVIGGKKEESIVDDSENSDHQKENLFPVKPLTAEEIEEMELKKRNENAVMGFPGEPLVDQMKFREMIPRIKNMVNVKFDKFKTITKDIDEISNELSLNIKAFIMDDIKALTNDVDALDVDVKKTVDERNNDCYKVVAANRGSVLFETTLYPMKEEIEEEEDTKDNEMEKRFEELMNDKAKLTKFFDSVADSIDMDKFKNVSSEEARNSIIAQLYVSLFDKKEHSNQEPYASSFKAAREAATEYVDKYFTFNSSDDEKEATVADEL